MYGIYRHRNREHVLRLLESCRPAVADVHLWCLDRPVDSLASFTRGVGPGGRSGLLRSLIQAHPPVEDLPVAIVDDDVRFHRGGLSELLHIAKVGELDLYQPAHHRPRNASHAITVRRPFSRARATAFVEIGPVVVVEPALVERLVADLPDEGMGWGTETIWSGYRRDGARLGIVDAVTIEHLQPVGSAYDTGRAGRSTIATMTPAAWRALTVTTATWWVWQSHAPWATSEPDS